MAGMMSMNNHLKCVLGFRGVFDLDFFFIVDIWNNVQKGSEYNLSSISYQTFVLSQTSSDLVELCPNL